MERSTLGLKILQIQKGATFQDLGRPGFRKVGVPPAGAFDRRSFTTGNRALGNPEHAPAIEFTIMGGRFLATTPLEIVVSGAFMPVQVNGKAQNGIVRLQPGDELRIDPAQNGARAYLCVSGGFRLEPVLGSVSGIQPEVGNVYPTGTAMNPGSCQLGQLPDRDWLAVLPGPDGAQITEPRSYIVSPNSSRAGVRLDPVQPGPMVVGELPSEPMCVGTIQATPSGQLVIIGPDGPTIGGYPKVGVVPQEEMDKVAQLLPGETVRLVPRT